MNQSSICPKERTARMEKYVVRCFCTNLSVVEERTGCLLMAIRIKTRLNRKNPNSYCYIIKVPFRKRYPDFPLWFAIISLWFVILSQEVEMCICHILQIMQQWK